MQPKFSVVVAGTPFCNGKFQRKSQSWFPVPPHVAVLKYEYLRRKTIRCLPYEELSTPLRITTTFQRLCAPRIERNEHTKVAASNRDLQAVLAVSPAAHMAVACRFQPEADFL